MSRTSRIAPLLLCLAALLTGCETAPVETASPTATTPPPDSMPVPQVPPETTPPEIAPEPAPPPVVEVKEPEPAPAPAVVCPPPPKPQSAVAQRPPSVIPILGDVELVGLEPPGLRLEARLDTGAAGSQLDARNVREFERDGKAWVKFTVLDPKTQQVVEVSRPVLRTTAAKGSVGARRYVVSLRTTLGGIDQFTDFALIDRTGQAHPVVLGRNFLRDQALVDVARRFTVPVAKP